MTSNDNDLCTECGMRTTTGEYHPYAACLMFKACHDSATVRSNLKAVVEYGTQQAGATVREAVERPVHAQ